ncbi:MAG: MBL fold metallo-hydrolase, partial [Pseudomonadota bacterium]|nr:MBL fold metallo-hydrolase [Pseudomonadota bacterium]
KATKRCAIIDPVLNYNPQAGKTSTASADKIIAYIKKSGLKTEWILETHVHADHLTAASYLKENLGGKLGIGEHVVKVLAHWVKLFNTAYDTPLDGSQFDHLFKDGERFSIGNVQARVLHTPGHTPDSISYLIEDAIFVGDTLFMPAIGTARTDFPGGSAKMLYRSIQRILSLPDKTRIFHCHDYPPEGKKPRWESAVAEQKKNNAMVGSGVSEAAYVKARNKRDKGKAVPRLLLPAIQTNLRAGGFGEAEANDIQFIKIPLNQF